MSKRKRNQVQYSKPELPSFLKKIREQIAYKDERLADLEKRQKLEREKSGKYEGDEENPQVVVLKEGDLTAEEANLEKKRIDKEENEKPADLSQRIIFKAKIKPVDEKTNLATAAATTSSNIKENQIKNKRKKEKSTKHKLLSFNDEEDEAD